MKKKQQYKNLREIVELIEKDFEVKDCEMYATLDYIDLKELKNLLDDYDYFASIEKLREGRKYYKKYLKERRKEEPDLLLPDFDEIYEKYFEQKEKIEELEIAIQGLIIRDNGISLTYSTPLKNRKKRGK